ncbi:hypothetical protein ABK040_014517 [Willaertia magna]
MRRFRSKKSTQISMRQNLPSPSSSSSSSESENEEVGETTLGGSQQLNIIGETTSNVYSRESDTFDPQEMMNASKKQKPNEEQPSLSPSPPNITQDTSFNIRPPFDDTPSPILPQNPLEEQQQVTSPPIDIPNRMEEEETIENLPNTNNNNVNIPPPTNLPPPTAIEQREADDYYEKGTARKSTSGTRSRKLYRSSNANKNRASSSTTAATTQLQQPLRQELTTNNGTPRRPRNTYKYLDEVRKYQKSGDKLIPKAPFRRFIKHILCEVLKENYRIRVSAVDDLHEAAESYLISVFNDAYLCTLHAKRVTLMDRDIHLAIRLQSGKNRFV